MPVKIDLSPLNDLNPKDPVTMLNLLRYKEVTETIDNGEKIHCTGREAYGRYAAHTTTLAAALPINIVYAGHAVAHLVASDDLPWDDILVVQYPSVQSFIDMISSEAYQRVVHLRNDALEDSRLIAMQDGLQAGIEL